MRARELTKPSTIVMILALTVGTFACGDDDDDDDDEAAEETTAETTGAAPQSETTAAPTETTAAPTTAAPTTTEPESTGSEVTETTAEPPDPCEPVGTLVPGDYGLNDRCEEPAEGWAAAFVGAGLAWGGLGQCSEMIAVPNELLVVVDPDRDLLEEVNGVIGVLAENPGGVPITAEPGEVLIPAEVEFSSQAQVVQITSAPNVDDVLALLNNLQGVGRSVDLNYLEPAQPNNGFRPADDPQPTDVQPPTSDAPAGSLSVAVIDSTNDQSFFDVDGNRMVDEDNGHGQFVTSIIQRYGASVILHPVTPSPTNPSVRPGPAGPGTGRWAPMLFEDKDIIRALAEVDPQTDVINMSLGGVGCTSSGFEWGIGERLALAHTMSNMRLTYDSMQFVAAAGNNGDDVLHFPAAWRNANSMSAIADAIELNDPDAAADVRAMSEILRDAMYAVGSVETEDEGAPRSDVRSDFSNCGDWVNAAAYGRLQVGEYPSSQPPTTEPATGFPESEAGNAMWSGTSFAAANFTAALATDLVDRNNFTDFDPSTGARMTDQNTGLAC